MVSLARALALTALLLPGQLLAGPAIQTWTTDNGAKVLFYPAPELPMVDIRATFDAGSMRDAERAGIARLTNTLLAEGAAGLDAQAIAERFEQTGARFSSGSLREMAWIGLRSLTASENLEPALKTFVQVLTQPAFDARAVERVRGQLLTALEQSAESPSAVAERAFYQALYGDHPYANPPDGERDTLESISTEDLRTFYGRYYVARNLTLAMVGDLERTQAEQIARMVTAGLPQGVQAPAIPPPAPLAEAKTVRVEFPSRQSHILIGTIGMQRGDPRYFDLYVGNHVFGGSGFASRLLTTIRERHGLAYSASSYFVPMAERGPFMLGVQTRGEQADRVIQLAQSELQQYVASGASAEELKASQRNITGGFALRIDSNRKLLRYLTTIGFYDLPLDYLDRFNDRIDAVSLRSLREALQARIDPDRLLTVIVGDTAG